MDPQNTYLMDLPEIVLTINMKFTDRAFLEFTICFFIKPGILTYLRGSNSLNPLLESLKITNTFSSMILRRLLDSVFIFHLNSFRARKIEHYLFPT